MSLDVTHDPSQRSWVESAHRAGGDFPIQNLPHGVFTLADGAPRGGVAIGDRILDVGHALDAGLLPRTPATEAAACPALNALLALGRPALRDVRAVVFGLLAEDSPQRAAAQALGDALLVPMAAARLQMPVRIGAFTDFMTSVHHVTAARRARPARPLNENFLHLPVAYNARATSITPDGRPFERPWGQRKEGEAVVFAPTAELDFELEFGALVGPGNGLGQPVSLDAAEAQIVGYVLVNDWSARDIQRWEMRLGPFLGKSFRTTISPWIVTAEAMEPFRVAPLERGEGEPQPPPYLQSDAHRARGALALDLQAWLSTARLRAAGAPPACIVQTSLLHCSWTLPQMLAHHTSNGCNLEPGDLISSGTVSGPAEDAAACLFERTAGVLPLDLPGGEQRVWLEDGDELVITGRAERDGFVGVGFGPCGARVLAARPYA